MLISCSYSTADRYHAADQHLCFRVCEKQVFAWFGPFSPLSFDLLLKKSYEPHQIKST